MQAAVYGGRQGTLVAQMPTGLRKSDARIRHRHGASFVAKEFCWSSWFRAGLRKSHQDSSALVREEVLKLI